MNKLYAFLLICTSVFGFSQTKKDYIYDYAKLAVNEMEVARIPASITLAQGILESRYGTSELASKSNNHFGIKCHKSWNGQSVKYDDDAKDECFRKYLTAAESFRDHSSFLSTRGRYSDLFKLSIYDYKGWAKGLRKAGYATNPKYADHLIKIIEEEQLYVFDRMASHEVDPYIASLRNNVRPNEVFVVKVEEKKVDKPANKPSQQPVQTASVKKVITVQGGPAAAPEDDIVQSRDIFIENDIKAVFSFTKDTPAALAAMYDVPIKRLYKYNEWPEYLNEFTWGMKVYLQPKRSKSRDISQLYHKVKQGETMYQIAQHYGIKTEKLYKWNLMSQDKREQPRAGEMISLRKKVSVKPLLRRPQDKFSVEQMPQQNQDKEVVVTSEATPQKAVTQKPTEQPVAKPQKPVIQQPQTEPTSKPATAQTGNQPQTTTEDPWATYPSTKTEEQRKAEEKTTTPKTNGQQQGSGRSIIYDNTPPVNQQPVKAYEPPKNQTKQKPQTSSNSTVLNPKPATQPKPEVNNTQYHKVVKGDTLYSLSKKYGVSVTQIKEWNNLSGNTIKLGQRLAIKK